MRTLRFSIIIGSIFLLIGCVRSKYPLYAKNDLIFEHSLVGTWSNAQWGAWQFRKKGGKKYLLIRKMRGTQMSYMAELGRIDSDLFLDAYPLSSARNVNIYTKLVPVHLYIKLKIKPNHLILYPLNEQWLRFIAISHRIPIPYKMFNNEVILTASSDKLQSFIKKYANNRNAFGTSIGLKREP